MSKAGRFVVIEGTDGSGTTTQARLLVAWLRERGIHAVGTCEPSRGPVGKLIRTVLEKSLMRDSATVAELDWTTLALLFAADRMDHIAAEVHPQLDRGTWVVSDRYDLSSYIYQSLTAPDADSALRWVRQLNSQARRPDLLLVLDVDPEQALLRRQQRGGPEELFERQELQLKLAQAYRMAEHYLPDDPLLHVDANQALSAVTLQIRRIVEGKFPLSQ
jgi:dTMP kinase